MHIMQIMVNISDGIKRLNHNSKLIIAQNKQFHKMPIFSNGICQKNSLTVKDKF